MFQSFEIKSISEQAYEKVQALRSQFDVLGIDGFLVPHSDEYRGENISPSSERLSWLTGFTGSAGTALLLKGSAIIFIDGRYNLQVEEELDMTLFSKLDLVTEPPAVWVSRYAPLGFRLGIDPWLHTVSEAFYLEKNLSKIDGSLICLPYNPIDLLWSDRPEVSMSKIELQKINYVGISSKDKLVKIYTQLSKEKIDAVLICDPSSVAWLFNIRASDVLHTPYPLARAILYSDARAELFLDKRRTDKNVEECLSKVALLLNPENLEVRLSELTSRGASILIDPDWTPYALFNFIDRTDVNIVKGPDPSRLSRAVKNEVEINGIASAHIQDGAAMVSFLAWLHVQKLDKITEIDVVNKLEECRVEMGKKCHNPLKDIAFDTIAASGNHAAIIHYRVTTKSNRFLKEGELFLLDSGGQYLNGTTDITRTITLGDVDDEKKRFFTLVLKGVIAISTARFPQGTRGCDLDILARLPLWKAGVDFPHSVGHGVGCYLSVHEGPQAIARGNQEPLLPGMVVSNEPGYYRPGSFGIRIENLLYVSEAEEIKGGDQPMLGFKTLTFCPIDLKLIVLEILSEEELKWLNNYHKRTREVLTPLLDDRNTLDWLFSATNPVEI
ncbi:Xaa-Pro aminopeptidase [Liberibacter crescens BT-1]|uniref:Xaa-Pro aminopeptidase n=1 Tax=Liberibacter crescens (strain BT-1) TaxID=1215343 RepID=L0EW21_LIBCB|nr:aminopeptidase P family protein [Liberibacter crescens]AGA65157.1 Xaa-Pro aminopeptidase [Liberibacter crescens BT-1]AMC13120.1 X-Pro aminopeptidase [Liberibacter crescens]